jgi:hypothetical protein
VTDDEEFTIRNIPASVLSDIERLDEAISVVTDISLGTKDSINWDTVLDALGDARSALLYLAEKHDQLTVKLQEHTMTDGIIVLDQPDQIRAFYLLQIYYKLKMEVEHPNGPRWRESPLRQACQELMRANIAIDQRTRKWVFPIYKAYLVSIGVLRNEA